MSIELKAYIAALTADGSPDGSAEYVVVYDPVADALKKVLLDNLPGGGGGLSGLGGVDNAVLRANGTGGATAQGSLMTIDDNGAPSIPDTQFLTSASKRLIGYNAAGSTVSVNVDGVGTLSLGSGAGGDIRMQHYLGDLFALFDDNATAQETRMKLWDVTAAEMVRVSRGASDSGGTGFRLLRIPN